MSALWISGLVSAVLGLASAVLALSSSLWLQIRYPYLKNDVGLMRHCDVSSSYCGDMYELRSLVDPRYAGWFRTLQTIYILHTLGLLISTCMYILYTVHFIESKGSFIVLRVFNILASIFGLSAVIWFAVGYDKLFGLDNNPALTEYATLDWAFYVAVAGCCFAFLSSVFSEMEVCRAADILVNMQNRLQLWTSPYTLFVDQDAA